MAVFRAPRTLAGRMTTSRGPGARCTPRPSPPPSLACPSARLQSKDNLYSRAQLNFFQALLCEAQTAVAGSRGEAGRRGGHQDLNQPSRVKDSGQHCRILYCRRLHGGEMFTYPVLYQHHEKVKRAWYYCKACHEDVKNENQIKKCKCKNCGYFLSRALS